VKDVRDALEALKDITGAAAFEFDGLGRAELIIEDHLSIYLFRVSDSKLELAAYTTTSDRYVSLDQLKALLRLNSLKGGPRQARFALDAKGVPFLCQRIHVQRLDRDELDRQVLGFIKCVATFRDADLSRAADPGMPVRAEDLLQDSDTGPIIRA
jgi:hypothetical protein